MRYWTLAMLSVVAFLATLDRQAFAVLLVPIQQELQVSDGAMGFLMGSAFALAQAVFSLPTGRLVDRVNRRNLIAIALVVWSLATLLAGFASSFFALLAARLVVGAAEAAQTPVTASMVSDLFSRNRRGTAFMFCSVGMGCGVAFGTFAGGTLSDLHGWHMALVVVGAPGLLVAALLRLTVTEPPRPAPPGAALVTPVTPTILRRVRDCLAIRTLPPFILAFALFQGAVTGWFVWFPVLLMRVHGLTATQMGSVFGVVVLCGALAAVMGGLVSDRLARDGARWRMQFLVAITLGSIPLLAASSLVESVEAAQWCAIAFAVIAGTHHPAAMATYTSIAPPAMRGSVASVVYLAVLIGSAVVPLVFGLATDLLDAAHGDMAVRFTLLLAPLLLLLAAAAFWLAGRSVEEDTDAADAVAE